MTNSSSNDPSKAAGKIHSMKGSAVESIGDLAGSQSWTQAGKEEHARGEAEYKAAQAQGFAEGTADRLGGYKDSVVGAVKGDKGQQATGNARNEAGRTEQDINKP